MFPDSLFIVPGEKKTFDSRSYVHSLFTILLISLSYLNTSYAKKSSC